MPKFWQDALIVSVASLLICTGVFIFAQQTKPIFFIPTATSSVLEAATIPPPKPVATTPIPKNFTLLAVGDIMVGRTVERLMAANGADYPFARLGNLFADTDVVFGNLEGPITDPHHPTPNGSTRFSFVESTAQTLADHGFNVVSLANNHTLDWGQSNYDLTAKTLDQAGIKHFGHYSNEAYDSIQLDQGDITTTLVGFNLIQPAFNEKAALDWVKKVDAEREGDLLIASVHWGTEYTHQPSTQQKNFAHHLIENGVDLIIGQHPHVVQGIEQYQEKLIFYSFGNFIFDQYFSQPTQESLAVKFSFEPNHQLSVNIIPLALPKSQPGPIENPTDWLKWFATISEPILRPQIETGLLRQTLQP